MRARSELPSALQKLVRKTERCNGAWQSWSSQHRIQLLVAEISLALSRERGSAVLQVHNYNEQGELQEYSTWMQLADNPRRETNRILGVLSR